MLYLSTDIRTDKSGLEGIDISVISCKTIFKDIQTQTNDSGWELMNDILLYGQVQCDHKTQLRFQVDKSSLLSNKSCTHQCQPQLDITKDQSFSNKKNQMQSKSQTKGTEINSGFKVLSRKTNSSRTKCLNVIAFDKKISNCICIKWIKIFFINVTQLLSINRCFDDFKWIYQVSSFHIHTGVIIAIVLLKKIYFWCMICLWNACKFHKL